MAWYYDLVSCTVIQDTLPGSFHPQPDNYHKAGHDQILESLRTAIPTIFDPRRRDIGRPTINLARVLIGWIYYLASDDHTLSPFFYFTSSQISLIIKNATV